MSLYPDNGARMAGTDRSVSRAERPLKPARAFIAPSRQTMIAVAFLIVLDLAIILPIVNATPRPTGWTSQSPAGGNSNTPGYSYFRYVSFQGASFGASVWFHTTNAPCALQRNSSMLVTNGWTNVASTIPTKHVVYLIDSNAVTCTGSYRVKQTVP